MRGIVGGIATGTGTESGFKEKERGLIGFAGSQTQKGIASYGLSANRQRPFAGALHNAIFNTFRRTRFQILYWVPPMVIGYMTMEWAIERLVLRLPIPLRAC